MYYRERIEKMSLASEKLRKEFAANDAIRDAGLTTPECIMRFDDIAYGDHFQQKLDVYRPKNLSGKLPVVVSVHGGGWVYGDKELYQYYTMDIAKRGFAVVNFSYRLAPETKYPAQLEDVNSVFLWVKANAEKYGLDTERLFAIGDSAGAHLLGLYCNICTNPDYAKLYKLKEVGPLPQAVSFACGVYSISIENMQGDNERMLDLATELLPIEMNNQSLQMIDVTKHLTPDFPPTFVFTCTGDFMQPQAELLQNALRIKKVPHVLRFYADAKGDLGHVFHIDIRSKKAIICNDEQCNFFMKISSGVF